MQKPKELQPVASWSFIISYISNVPYFLGYDTRPPSNKLMPKSPMQTFKGKGILTVRIDDQDTFTKVMCNSYLCKLDNIDFI